MGAIKKITVNLPEDLLQRAQESTRAGITETLRMALKILAAQRSYAELKNMKGKLIIKTSLKKIREDRE